MDGEEKKLHNCAFEVAKPRHILDPDIFISKVKDVCIEAKEATKKLLEESGDKYFVVNFDNNLCFDTGNGTFVAASVMGQDSDKGMVVGGTYIYDNGSNGFEIEGYNADFKSVETIVPDTQYPKLYAFLVSNINNAVTRDEAENMLTAYGKDDEVERTL